MRYSSAEKNLDAGLEIRKKRKERKRWTKINTLDFSVIAFCLSFSLARLRKIDVSCVCSPIAYFISRSFYLVFKLNEINQKIIKKNEEKRNREIQRRKIIRVYKMLERFIEIRIDVGRHGEW